MPSDSRIAGAATAAVYRVFGFGHKGALEIKRRASAVVLVLFLFGNIASIVLGQTCANSACQACSAAYANALVGCALSGGSCASAYGWYQACLAAAGALPIPTPAPPSPSTPCSSGGGLEARPARGSQRKNSLSPRDQSSQVPCVWLIDPVADLIDPNGIEVIQDPERLAIGGTPVTGIAADGAARLVVLLYANSPGDQLTVTLTPADSVQNQNDLPQPIGTLQTILASDGTQSGTLVTVTAVDTTIGALAFVQYFPPRDFSRGGPDDASSSRSAKISVTSSARAANYTANVTIWRPPVVLVHGIWGTLDDWDLFAFDPQTLQSFSPAIGQFWTEKAHYSDPVSIESSTPQYQPVLIANARENSLGFAYNAQIVLPQIGRAIADFRQTRQAAAAQADIVAHSMGGDVTRECPLDRRN